MELFVRIRGRQHGPFDSEKLASMIQRGQLTRAMMVSEDGANWQKAGEHTSLFELAEQKRSAVLAAEQAAENERQRLARARTEEENWEKKQKSALESDSVEWYYEAKGTPVGPIPLNSLKPLIAAGTIGPKTKVWAAHLADWIPAAQCAELSGSFGQHKSTGLSDDFPWLPPGKWLRSINTSICSSYPYFDRPSLWRAITILHGVCTGIILLHLAFIVIVSVKKDLPTEAVVEQLVIATGLLILHGVGSFVIQAIRGPVDDIVKTPYQVRSFAVFHILSVFFFFSAICSLLGIPLVIISTEQSQFAVLSSIGLVVNAYLWVVIGRAFGNPESMELALDKSLRASQDSLAILAGVFCKVPCQLVPFVTSLLNIVGLSALFFSDFLLLSGNEAGTDPLSSDFALLLGSSGLQILILASFYGLLTYFVSVLILVGIDIARSFFVGLKMLTNIADKTK